MRSSSPRSMEVLGHRVKVVAISCVVPTAPKLPKPSPLEQKVEAGGGRKETVPVEPRKRTTLRLKARGHLRLWHSGSGV